MPKTKQYQIVNARVDQASGGPDMVTLVAELEIKAANAKSKPFFFTLVETGGMPMIYKTKASVFDWWMQPDKHEADLDDLQEAGTLYEGENYAKLFESLKSIECYEGLRYLIYMMRASWDDAEAFVKTTQGMILSEIEIPKSDVEEEWENDKGESFKNHKNTF